MNLSTSPRPLKIFNLLKKELKHIYFQNIFQLKTKKEFHTILYDKQILFKNLINDKIYVK